MSRGGRGGRGGASKTFNREQLNSLGIGPGEILPGVTLPPPTYPLMDRQPVPINSSEADSEYLLILQQDFIDQMLLSGYYLEMPTPSTQPQQEIDKLVAQIPSTKVKYDWSLFPSELRPKMMARKTTKKTVKDVNVAEKLSLLEKLEQKNGSTRTEEKDDEDELNDEENVDEPDEEMDDGTDYANNYFDNGEGYEDEDDNLDSGATY